MNIGIIDLTLTPHLIDMTKEMSIVDGIPFVVGDDFSFDPTLNAALKSLVNPQRRSRKTWKSYAEAIALFIRFLNAQELHWLEVDSEVIQDYWRARRLSPSFHKKNGSAISASSWNLTVSALDVLYNYAQENGLIKKLPFKIGKARENGGNVEGASGMKEKREIKPKKSIKLEQYKSIFLPALANKRTSQRDISLSNFLLTTGCRIEESINLNVYQLPDPDSKKYAGLRAIPFEITGKGNKTRVIRIPKYVLHEINIYIREDRADSLDRWESKHHLVKPNSKEYPKGVWLSERGTRLSVNSADKIFEIASELSGVHVHPHMLRHTFGIYTLSGLIKGLIDVNNQNNKYRKIIRDPLRTLQMMMGHSLITTTYEYLDYIEDEEDYIYSALDLWTSEIYQCDLDA